MRTNKLITEEVKVIYRYETWDRRTWKEYMPKKKSREEKRHRTAIPREKLFPRVALINGEWEKDYRYVFDADGNVYRFSANSDVPMKMKPYESADGYHQIDFPASTKFPEHKGAYVHREILFSFAYKEIVEEQCPFTQFYDSNSRIQKISSLEELKRLYSNKGYQVHHKDLDRKNNRISNDNDSNLRLMSAKTHSAIHDRILPAADDQKMVGVVRNLLANNHINEDTVIDVLKTDTTNRADIYRAPGYTPGEDAVRYPLELLSWKGGTARGTGVQFNIADQVVEDYLSLGGDMQSLNETVKRVAKEGLAKLPKRKAR